MHDARAKIAAGAMIAVGLLAFALPAAAQSAGVLGMGPVQAVIPATDFRSAVAELIRFVLGVMAVYFLLQAIWGGFLMATHGGKEDKISAAKSHIAHSVLGICVIMLSSSVTSAVVNAAMNATSGLTR